MTDTSNTDTTAGDVTVTPPPDGQPVVPTPAGDVDQDHDTDGPGPDVDTRSPLEQAIDRFEDSVSELDADTRDKAAAVVDAGRELVTAAQDYAADERSAAELHASAEGTVTADQLPTSTGDAQPTADEHQAHVDEQNAAAAAQTFAI